MSSESGVDNQLKKLCVSSNKYCPIVHQWNVPEKYPVYGGGFPSKLHERVASYFSNVKLYKHQYEFIEHAVNGEDCFIISGTGGGKTLSFLLPVLHRIFNGDKALIIYPTKALSYDQYLGFKNLPINIGVLDGDSTNKNECLKSDLIITNPQALSVYLSMGILDSKTIKKIGVVVIDEFHFLRGAEAGNFALTLRDFLFKNGDRAQLLVASATVGNPEELVSSYFPHRNFSIIRGDYGRVFEKDYLVFNYSGRYDRSAKPPINIIKSLPDWLKEWYGTGMPRISEVGVMKFSLPLISELVYNNSNVIVFCRRKADCEKLLGMVQEYAYDKYGISKSSFSTYYSDFPKDERREIENNFRKGAVKCLISTSALEVGIDLTVDCVVCIDSCDTVNSFKQQVGRAGRKSYGLVIYLPQGDSMLSNYLLKKHPNSLPLERVKLFITKDSLKQHILSLFNKKVVMDDEKFELFKKIYGIEGVHIFESLRFEGILSNKGKFVYNSGEKVVPLIFEGGVIPIKDESDNIISKISSNDVWRYPVGSTVVRNRKYYRVVETYKKGHEYILVEPTGDGEVLRASGNVRLDVICSDGFGSEFLVRKVPLYLKSHFRKIELTESDIADYWEVNYGLVAEGFDDDIVEKVLEYIKMVYSINGEVVQDGCFGKLILFPIKIGYLEFEEIISEVMGLG